MSSTGVTCVLLASHTADHVTGVRLIKLNEHWVGLIADLRLMHGIARPRLLQGSPQQYWIAHNTDFNAAAHILHQGIWRPSNYDPRTSCGRLAPHFTQGDTLVTRRSPCFRRLSRSPIIVHVVFWANPSCASARTYAPDQGASIRISLQACIMMWCVQGMGNGFRASTSRPSGFAIWEY